jgi:hypothetical protein
MGSTFNFQSEIHGQGHVFGDHAHQENRFGNALDAEERRQLVEELVQEVRVHAAELPDPDEMIATADEFDTELRRDEPRRGSLRQLVNNLTLGAAGVTAVAEAVDKIRRALGLGT